MAAPTGFTPGKNTDGLKSQKHGFVKQYVTFDGEGRPISVITAPTDAPDQAPATEVLYEYVGPNSNRVAKMKERSYDGAGAKILWLAAYDIVGA